jgi:serine/threonine protein kinase
MSTEAKDLIKKLLCRDPKKRLGSSKDSEELKEHPFFAGVNWQDVFNRKLPMPPVDIPKINENETLKISFNSS